ncbi:MAG TPA: DUF1501 domain-containing protein [Candidatus Limnocylindria bacterium]|jgi:hypothetical protein|nr:DUF1501 domain-containing protein [Candidatus Limnocylindria bacterium]
MLTIPGTAHRPFCDGHSRRDFMRIGSLAMGGLALPQLLQAEQLSGIRKSHKAVIMIYLVGAPPHQDMFDLKMDAPLEIRGPHRPRATNVPGIEISEHMPYCARIMDKLVPIRTMYGSPSGDHDSFICYTGRPVPNQPPGGWPSLGSTLSKLQGPTDPTIPAFVGLAPKAGHPPYGSPGLPGFLGPTHSAFRPNGPGMDDLKLNGVSLDRLSDRRALLAGFDHFRRDLDSSGIVESLDAFNQEAFNILTSSKLLEALDVSREPAKVRERYGKGDPKSVADGAPRNCEQFLVARRLVEAGARCVTLNFGRWDFHSNNHSELLTHLPLFDQAMSALVEDLHERGMDKDVAVVAWGEFGRTPQINADAGRDHWPQLGCALLAGGGMRTGQVIGATDRLGGEIAERGVHFGEVFATLYNQLGLDLAQVTLPDLAGRPHYLVDGWQPMKELVG